MTDPAASALVEETPGWEDLEKWFAAEPAEGEPRRTLAFVAEKLGVSGTAVRTWRTRIARPSAGPLRDALCRLIDSSPERWETVAERAAREELEEKVPLTRGAA